MVYLWSVVQNTSYVHLTKMDIQIDSEIHHLSFFRCIGYKSDFPFYITPTPNFYR